MFLKLLSSRSSPGSTALLSCEKQGDSLNHQTVTLPSWITVSNSPHCTMRVSLIHMESEAVSFPSKQQSFIVEHWKYSLSSHLSDHPLGRNFLFLSRTKIPDELLKLSGEGQKTISTKVTSDLPDFISSVKDQPALFSFSISGFIAILFSDTSSSTHHHF